MATRQCIELGSCPGTAARRRLGSDLRHELDGNAGSGVAEMGALKTQDRRDLLIAQLVAERRHGTVELCALGSKRPADAIEHDPDWNAWVARKPL